jgi:hypothetical protein
MKPNPQEIGTDTDPEVLAPVFPKNQRTSGTKVLVVEDAILNQLLIKNIIGFGFVLNR